MCACEVEGGMCEGCGVRVCMRVCMRVCVDVHMRFVRVCMFEVCWCVCVTVCT